MFIVCRHEYAQEIKMKKHSYQKKTIKSRQKQIVNTDKTILAIKKKKTQLDYN